jgi:hypothetical protein
MITRLRILGICLGATFALGVTATSASALPEFGPPTGKFTVKSKTTKFETASKVKITCLADTGSGEITGPTTASMTVRFTSCTSSAIVGVMCQSPGLAPGEITTFPLFGKLGYISREPELEVGLDLANPAAGIFTEFMCGAALERLSGSVIGKITPINKPTKKLTLKFVQKKGIQKPLNLLGEPPDFLMNGNPEPVGLASSEGMTFAAPVVVIA